MWININNSKTTYGTIPGTCYTYVPIFIYITVLYVRNHRPRADQHQFRGFESLRVHGVVALEKARVAIFDEDRRAVGMLNEPYARQKIKARTGEGERRRLWSRLVRKLGGKSDDQTNQETKIILKRMTYSDEQVSMYNNMYMLLLWNTGQPPLACGTAMYTNSSMYADKTSFGFLCRLLFFAIPFTSTSTITNCCCFLYSRVFAHFICPFFSSLLLLRGTIVNRTCGIHKNVYMYPFLQTIFGLINYLVWSLVIVSSLFFSLSLLLILIVILIVVTQIRGDI